MSFFKRLFGITESRQGEILTKIDDQTWVSTTGEIISQISDEVSVSSGGTVYTRTGDNTVVASDGSLFTDLGGSMSSDGSFRHGPIATGRGAIFNDENEW